nr:MAG TPA: hypothetical protein [Caudoviricetes sp.]
MQLSGKSKVSVKKQVIISTAVFPHCGIFFAR